MSQWHSENTLETTLTWWNCARGCERSPTHNTNMQEKPAHYHRNTLIGARWAACPCGEQATISPWMWTRQRRFLRTSGEHTLGILLWASTVLLWRGWVHVTEDLSWSNNTSALANKAHQWLYFLCKLRRARAPAPIMCSFCKGTTESILTCCITVWYRA